MSRSGRRISSLAVGSRASRGTSERARSGSGPWFSPWVNDTRNRNQQIMTENIIFDKDDAEDECTSVQSSGKGDVYFGCHMDVDTSVMTGYSVTVIAEKRRGSIFVLRLRDLSDLSNRYCEKTEDEITSLLIQLQDDALFGHWGTNNDQVFVPPEFYERTIKVTPTIWDKLTRKQSQCWKSRDVERVMNAIFFQVKALSSHKVLNQFFSTASEMLELDRRLLLVIESQRSRVTMQGLEGHWRPDDNDNKVYSIGFSGFLMLNGSPKAAEGNIEEIGEGVSKEITFSGFTMDFDRSTVDRIEWVRANRVPVVWTRVAAYEAEEAARGRTARRESAPTPTSPQSSSSRNFFQKIRRTRGSVTD